MKRITGSATIGSTISRALLVTLTWIARSVPSDGPRLVCRDGSRLVCRDVSRLIGLALLRRGHSASRLAAFE
jgi:hypothetical protein